MPTPSAETSIAYARAYYKSGITVVPMGKDKHPLVSWKEYQSRPQREEEVEELFSDSSRNVGILTGTPSDNHIVLDHDSRDLCIQLSKYRIYQHLQEVASRVDTRRGFHLHLRSPVPLKTSKCDRFKVDVLAEKHLVVAPLSRIEREHHRDQLYLFSSGRWMPFHTLTPEEYQEVAELYGFVELKDNGYAVPENQGEDFGDIAPFYGLGLKAMEALKNPLKDGDRSKVEGGIVLRAVGIGCTFEDVYRIFEKHAPQGSKFQEKQKAGYGESYLRIHYDNAYKKILGEMSEEARELNSVLLDLARRNPFTGRSARTDRAVFLALLDIQRQSAGADFRASLRRLAELAGVDPVLVSRSLDRLNDLGIVKIWRGTRKTTRFLCEPAEYRRALLGINVISQQYSTSLRGIVRGNGGREEIAPRAQEVHDAFRHGALGHEGRELLGFFKQVGPLPFTRADIPLPMMYLRRVLPVLEGAGIIGRVIREEEKKRGRPAIVYAVSVKIGFETLNAIAKAFGTLGAGEKQKARHARDRIVYKARFPREADHANQVP